MEASSEQSRALRVAPCALATFRAAQVSAPRPMPRAHASTATECPTPARLPESAPIARALAQLAHACVDASAQESSANPRVRINTYVPKGTERTRVCLPHRTNDAFDATLSCHHHARAPSLSYSCHRHRHHQHRRRPGCCHPRVALDPHPCSSSPSLCDTPRPICSTCHLRCDPPVDSNARPSQWHGLCAWPTTHASSPHLAVSAPWIALTLVTRRGCALSTRMLDCLNRTTCVHGLQRMLCLHTQRSVRHGLCSRSSPAVDAHRQGSCGRRASICICLSTPKCAMPRMVLSPQGVLSTGCLIAGAGARN